MGVYLRPKEIPHLMLVKRTLVTLFLLPVGIAIIFIGGPAYAGFLILVLGLAAWEYQRLCRIGGGQPAGTLVVVGVVLLVAARAFDGFVSASWMLSLLILASMVFHLFAYERGRDKAGYDFAITLSGILYIGWIGAYMISLRSIPEGTGWMLVVLPAVWFADAGAYLVGSRFGRHQLSPRLSPHKTWEGYVGGILFGTLAGAGLAASWQIGAGQNTAILPWRGAILGFILSVLTLFGDLGESMFKRQAGVKDSGNLLPGHGGIFDRIDSWLWAGVIGYYVILWFFTSGF
jgi:phosphatidate cytidylyltransferase